MKNGKNIYPQEIWQLYLRFTGSLLDVFLLLHTVILSEPHEIQRSKSKVQEKLSQKHFKWMTSLLWLTHSPLCLFLSLFLSTTLPFSRETNSLNCLLTHMFFSNTKEPKSFKSYELVRKLKKDQLWWVRNERTYFLAPTS